MYIFRMVIESVADQRQISESRAAHACLLLLIQKHHQLFLAPADMLARCKFNYFEESVPVSVSLIFLLLYINIVKQNNQYVTYINIFFIVIKYIVGIYVFLQCYFLNNVKVNVKHLFHIMA